MKKNPLSFLHLSRVLFVPFFSFLQRSPASSSLSLPPLMCLTSRFLLKFKRRTNTVETLRWCVSRHWKHIQIKHHVTLNDGNFHKVFSKRKNTFKDWMLNALEALRGTFQPIPYLCKNGYSACLIFHAQGCIKEMIDALCVSYIELSSHWPEVVKRDADSPAAVKPNTTLGPEQVF